MIVFLCLPFLTFKFTYKKYYGLFLPFASIFGRRALILSELEAKEHREIAKAMLCLIPRNEMSTDFLSSVMCCFGEVKRTLQFSLPM